MSRLQKCFEDLSAVNRKALIPFVTAGDPDKSITVPLMHAMVEAGVNVIELGVPFSDPMADGPAIQKASERSLAAGMTMLKVFDIVKVFRTQNSVTPVVLMGYLNPIETMGYENFALKASEAGIDGVLTVDMPPEEAKILKEALKGYGIDTIFLIAPTSTDERIKEVTDIASGFVYYVSLKGVTGSKRLDITSVAEKLSLIKSITSMPVGVGFGISDAESAAAVASVSDAVVVGSVLVNLIEKHKDDHELAIKSVTGLLNEMRLAMDAV